MRLTLYQPPKTIQLFNYYLLANLLIYMEKFSLIKVSGGDERIRTSDQSFSPDAPLAGECLRPARPRLRINAFTTPHSLTDYR